MADPCPSCHRRMSKTLQSRLTPRGRRRRYLCIRCGYRWTTMEVAMDGKRALSADPQPGEESPLRLTIQPRASN